MSKSPTPPRKSTSDKVDPDKPASIVINKIGGLKKFCEHSKEVLDKPYATSTVWSWMVNGIIPMNHVPNVKLIAKHAKAKIKDSDFIPQAAN